MPTRTAAPSPVPEVVGPHPVLRGEPEPRRERAFPRRLPAVPTIADPDLALSPIMAGLAVRAGG